MKTECELLLYFLFLGLVVFLSVLSGNRTSDNVIQFVLFLIKSLITMNKILASYSSENFKVYYSRFLVHSFSFPVVILLSFI